MKTIFGKNLNNLLKEHGMSAAELADKTGLSMSTLSRYRTGESQPLGRALLIIADYYQVRPAWLLLDEGPRQAEELSAEEKELLAFWRAPALALFRGPLLAFVRDATERMPENN